MWVLNGRRDPRVGLEKGLDGSAMVLVLVGRRWEELEACRRVDGKHDWVAWGVREAAERKLPVVLLFLRRTGPFTDSVPAALRDRLPQQDLCIWRETRRIPGCSNTPVWFKSTPAG